MKCWRTCTVLLLLVMAFGGQQTQAIDTKDLKLPIIIEYITDDGQLVKIPIAVNKVANVQDLLTKLKAQGALGKVTVFVSEVANSAELVIIGAPDDVAAAREQLKFIVGAELEGPKLLIDISVNLREFTQSDANSIGLNLFPSLSTKTTPNNSQFKNSLTQSILPPQPNTTSSSNDTNMGFILNFPDIDLRQFASIGKTLVSTDVMTPNGTVALISSEDHSPILTVSPTQIEATDQSVLTKISVKPVLLSYDPDNIQASLVKLDIDLSISLPTATVVSGNTQAIAYTTKALTTERVFRADGVPRFAGSFAEDDNYKENNYTPLLGEIPFLQYFFSKKGDTHSRQFSVLFIAVRFMPAY